jgi:hypothetical protein
VRIAAAAVSGAYMHYMLETYLSANVCSTHKIVHSCQEYNVRQRVKFHVIKVTNGWYFLVILCSAISQTNAKCYRFWYSIAMTVMSTSELYSLIDSDLFLIIVHISVRLFFIMALDPLLLPLSSSKIPYTWVYIGTVFRVVRRKS